LMKDVARRQTLRNRMGRRNRWHHGNTLLRLACRLGFVEHEDVELKLHLLAMMRASAVRLPSLPFISVGISDALYAFLRINVTTR
jgi:hypothetical protein